MTRYQTLREAVANLAAPPTLQADWLDQAFVQCTGGGSAAAYGNDELVLELDDIFIATRDMMASGEISADEVAAVKKLHDYCARFWEAEDAALWRREALFNNPRWQEVRALATRVLRALPNEPRESAYTREIADPTPAPESGSIISRLARRFLPRWR